MRRHGVNQLSDPIRHLIETCPQGVRLHQLADMVMPLGFQSLAHHHLNPRIDTEEIIGRLA